MNTDLDLSSITALVVDDSRYARSFIRTALTSFGLRSVVEAADGPAAFVVLAERPVHLVIVDYEMSPMNGIDFTRLLRSGQAVPCVDVGVVMVSGDASREVVVAARDAGVSEFLVKPLSTESLYRRVRSVLTSPRAFVQAPGFVGPDRRALARPPAEGERRVAPPLARPRPLLSPAVLSPAGAVAPPPPPAPAARTSHRRFAAGATIFAEGDPGDVAYVVEAGRVEIVKTVDGHATRLGLIGPNGVFGEMALIDGEPRMAGARAVEDTQCLIVPMAALRAQIGKTPDLVILVLETLLGDIRRMGRELGVARAALDRRRAGG